MKRIKLLALLFITALAVSCSSDDSAGGSTTPETTFSVDGQTKDVTLAVARRSEDSFVVSAQSADGFTFDLAFDKFGNFGNFEMYSSTDTEFVDKISYFDFSGNYFSFELVSVTDSTVKVTFSGKVYADENDLESEFTLVSGTFSMSYTDITAQLPAANKGFLVSAKIAGNQWYSTNSFTSNGEDFADYQQHHVSDDEYKILINYNEDSIAAENYTFTTASTTNRVRLAKFNTTTKEYTYYNVAGNMNVTSLAEFGFIGRVLEGTFTFTATNPENAADVIQVTDGKFKTLI